jgi:hypothetical protein
LSTTTTVTGSVSITTTGQIALSGDQNGVPSIGSGRARAMKLAAVAPDLKITGGLFGIFTATTTAQALDLTAADPFGTGGDSTPAQGFVVLGSVVRVMRFENIDPTNYVDILMPASGGVAFYNWAASQQIFRLRPNGELVIVDPANVTALTASNDQLSLIASAGTPQVRCQFYFGPP